jgi:Uma2 family endonuclease
MPDSELCELIEGRIVPTRPMSYIAGHVGSRLAYRLSSFVDDKRIGQVMVGEVGVYIRRNPDTIRAADVLYISNDRFAQSRSPSYLDVAPELVVEILSPDAAWQAVMRKLADYFSIGVQVVWVADPEARSVYAYRSVTTAQQFKEGDTLTVSEVLPGFAAPVADLFTE